MDFSEFTREQIESSLKALRIENATHLNNISKLKKEVKDLKKQISAFESDTLSRRNVARRSNVY
jgi:predicted  nucleic acid-binding Zn-ribbon protein